MTHGNEILEYDLDRYAIEKTRELISRLNDSYLPDEVKVEIVPRFPHPRVLAQTVVTHCLDVCVERRIQWAKHAIDVAYKFPLPKATRIIDSIAAHEAAHLIVLTHDECHLDVIHSLGHVDIFELPYWMDYADEHYEYIGKEYPYDD